MSRYARIAAQLLRSITEVPPSSPLFTNLGSTDPEVHPLTRLGRGGHHWLVQGAIDWSRFHLRSEGGRVLGSVTLC